MVLSSGSRTALLPYGRERYFENHKVLSACDKLHKLYASTAEPVVWARSVGVEVLNELDAVKAAIMLNAGSNPRARVSSGAQLGANAAADVIAGFARGLSQARTLGEGVGAMVGAGVQKALQSLGGSRSQR